MLNATNFREYRRGSQLYAADWTPVWAGATDLSQIDSSIFGDEMDPTRICWAGVGSSAAKASGLTWNAADGDPGRANQEVLVKYLLNGGDGETIALRIGGQAGSERAYLLRAWVSTGTLQLYSVGNIAALTSLSSVAKTFVSNTFAYFRMRANGTTIQARTWPEGTTEPVAWDITISSAAIADGSLGFAFPGTAAVGDLYFFSYGTNGDTAPAESFIPAGIADWSTHDGSEVEFTAEVETLDPDSGAVTNVFFSSYGRHTGRSDFPCNREIYPLLADPGSLTVTLSEDLLFGGESSISMGQVALTNPMIQMGPQLQRFLRDLIQRKTISGRKITIRAGRRKWPIHRWFEAIFTSTLAGEPDSGDPLTLALAEPYRQLTNNLVVQRNVGIATCVTIVSAKAVAPVNAAYDLTSFTVVWRFRYPLGVFSTGPDVGFGKGTALTAENFALFIEGGTGKVWARASCGGVPLGISIKTPAKVVDKNWHVAVFGVDGTHNAYLLVDGVLIGQMTPPAPVDTPSVGINLCVNGNGHSFCDVRVYGFCLSVDDARAASVARVPADDPGILSNWRCDDGILAIITDYGVLANHVTLTGTLGVDYLWDPTYLGQESDAGTPMPLAYGAVFNAPAPKADPGREIYRMADADQSNLTTVVRARGYVLTPGTDYTVNDNGTATMVSAQSEPVTYDVALGSQSSRMGAILQDALTKRMGYNLPTLDSDAITILDQLLPYEIAYYSTNDITGADFLSQILTPAGAHYRLDRDGRLSPGVVLPPITPGPYGGEPALEFSGLNRSQVLFSGNFGGGFTGSHTIIFWVKSYATDRAVQVPGGIHTNPYPVRQSIALKGDAAGSGYAIGLNREFQGAISVQLPGIAPLNFTSKEGAVGWGVWTMVALRYDQPGGGYSIFTAPKDSQSLTTQLDVKGVAGAITLGVGSLQLGGSLQNGSINGSLQHFQVWNGALSASAIEALAVTHPVGNEAGLLFYAPLTEGKGTAVTDRVSGSSGRVYCARWAPRAIFNFLKSLSKTTFTTKKLRPAWDAKLTYGINQSPLGDADIAGAGVTPAQKAALKKPNKTATAPALDIQAKYLDAREITQTTLLMSPTDAAKLAKNLRYRFDPSRIMGRIENAPRMALSLSPTDEIWVFHPDLPDAGAALRVVGFTPNLSTLRFAIDGWGNPLDPVAGTRLVDDIGDIGLVDDSGSASFVQ